MGVAVSPVRVDLGRYDDAEVLWKAVTGSGCPLDAAALTAGVGVGGAFIDGSFEADLKLVQLDVVSTMHMADTGVAVTALLLSPTETEFFDRRTSPTRGWAPRTARTTPPRSPARGSRG